MKIAFIDIQLDPKRPGITGLSSIVWDWAKQLVRLGDEVHIIGPYLEDIQGPQGAIIHRFPIPFLGYRTILGNIHVAYRAVQEAKKIPSLDILHAPEYLSTAVAAFLIKDIPIVLTTPGNIYERIAHGNSFNWSATQVYKIAARITSKKSSCIIAISNEMLYWWGKTGALTEKMVMIPYGVDAELFKPLPDAKTQLGLPLDNKVILYVGRLSHEKGLVCLLEAFAQVRRDFPEAELRLVGDGPLRQDLISLADGLSLSNHIHFHGWLDLSALPPFYAAADVVVLPSFSEGHPRTMLEALACGAPFVGTSISGVVDTITHEQTGLLAPPGQPEALAELIGRVLGDPQLASRLSHNGRQHILQNYTWEKIYQETRQAVYLPLLSKR